MKPQCLPLISQIYADKTPKQQNHIKLTTNPICLSLRNNAACCIPLRDLRYLRENIHARGLNLLAQMSPKVSRRSRRFTQTKPKTTKPQNSNNCFNLKQPVFLCEIMQLAAFLCVICVICGRITRKSTQSISTNEPQSLPQISQIYADETQNNKIAITATASNNLSFSAI